MKKKIITITVVLALALGSVQVYAATVLNSNIIELITSGFTAIKTYYLGETDKSMGQMDTQLQGNVDQYVDSKSQDVINQIDAHKNSEVNRAQQELNAYLDSAKQEIDALANAQVKDSKDKITSQINSSIDKLKEDINKELEKQIKDKLIK